MPNSSGNIYAPGKQDTAGQNASALNTLGQTAQATQGYAPAVSQQAQGITQQYINNPYQGAAQAGAGAAGAYGTGTVVPGQQQGAAALQGVGGANAGYVNQALAAGFDPQGALYNRNFQQQQDQTNAVNSMNGVAGTPYGAGVANQANQNFNLDWGNNQLQRQATAANTAATLGGSANTAYTGASTLGTGAMNTQVAASGLPASTYSQNLANDLSALSGQNTAVGGATGINDQALQSILSYLGYAGGAQQGKQTAINQTNSGLGSLLGTAGELAFA